MLRDLLIDHIRDPHASWACGRFGGIAEFHRDPDEPVEIAMEPSIVAATGRGAIRFEVLPGLRPFAYETISSCIESWGQDVVLCLPRDAAAMSRRSVVTELGPDRDAVRPQDRRRDPVRSRVIALAGGRVAADGPPDEALRPAIMAPPRASASELSSSRA